MGRPPRVTEPGLAYHPLAVARRRDWLAEVNRLMGQEALRCVRQAVTRGVPMGNETRKARVARRLGLDVTLRPRGRPRKDTQKSSWHL
jgi:putative transposase